MVGCPLASRFRSASWLLAASAAAWLLAVVTTTAAWAAEAYFQNGIGARQKALAGAGVASSTDATAVALNPAGLVNVQSQINAAVSFLYMDGGFSTSGTGGLDPDGHHDSRPGWLAIPNLAASWKVQWGLIDAIAFSAYGNGGVNTQYKNIVNGNCPVPGLTGVFCGGPLGVKLAQSFYSIAFAKQVAPGLSIGFAPIIASQWGEVEGVGFFGFGSSDPARFSNRGRDESWGATVRAGAEWKIAPNLRVGISGHPRIGMSNFDEYRGLLAERGDFDIPAVLQAGIAFDIMRNVTLLADYKRIWFGSVASVANPTTLFPITQFGADNGPGFGVKDVDVIKLGVEWRGTSDLTLRAGYSYNTAPIDGRDADLNIMTLGIVQHHITSGLQYKLTRNLDLELSAMYAPRATVSGVELGAPLRSVELEMSQFEFTAGIVYRFGAPPPAAPLK